MFSLKVSNKIKVIHHDIIMILVTTKMSKKSLKTVAMVTKILRLIPKLKIIYPERNSKKLGTQVYYILGS